MKKLPTDLVFKNRLWRYQGPAAWYFVTLPPATAKSVRALLEGHPRRPGFGSIRVLATIGDTTWATSIFPDRTTRSYLLPVKARIRSVEGIEEAQFVNVRLQVVG